MRGLVGLIRRARVASGILHLTPDAAWTPYPAYKTMQIQYIAVSCRPDKRSASGNLAPVITLHHCRYRVRQTG
ncbi:hypothetical protein C1192_11455 [Escherichia marmotae]|nr:hypothetical protein C1192_11455 [Escherichia marmotae]